MTATVQSALRARVKRADLINAIKHVAIAVTKKQTIPVLSGALVEAHAEGFLTLRGTDLQVAVQVPIPADVSSPGAVVVPLRDFRHLLAFCLGDEVSLSQHDARLTVQVGDDEFTLCGFHADGFPEPPTDEEFLPFCVIGRNELHELVSATALAVSTDEAKPWLTCIQLKVIDDELRAVTTDGSRIACWQKPVTTLHGGEAIIPPAALRVAADMAAPGEDIEVSINPGNRMKITGHDFVVWSRLLEAKYPEVLNLIPPAYPDSATVDRQALITALRAARVMAIDGSVKFTMGPNNMQLHSNIPERGAFTRRLAGTVTAGIGAIAFGADKLLKPLAAFRGAEVRFQFAGSRNPAKITCTDQPHFFYVVLPRIMFEGG